MNSRLERLIEAMGGMCDSPIPVEVQAREVDDLLRQRCRDQAGRENPLPGIDDENITGAAPLAERVFSCVNCLRDWAEPYCDECGRNLMEVNHGS